MAQDAHASMLPVVLETCCVNNRKKVTSVHEGLVSMLNYFLSLLCDPVKPLHIFGLNKWRCVVFVALVGVTHQHEEGRITANCCSTIYLTVYSFRTSYTFLVTQRDI
ncbi:hypothetical protein VNO78_28367 [Psophocarpus tetragonolobus]|uniref:Uncharacterized protein n=1 Tax=Psophocarpus tetragonolobus TaxID=3891 RepID=A0AAN9XD85_PSOTE